MLYLVAIAIQIACLAHALRTHQERQWIWIIMLLPLAGSAAYLLMVVAPDLFGVRGVQRLEREVRRTVNPEGALRAAERAVAATPTTENWRKLAAVQVEMCRWDEALASFNQALSGHFASDPDLLHGKAYVQLEKGDAAGALRALDTLVATDPDFRRDDIALLFARAYEAVGRWEEAQKALEGVLSRFPGEEVRARLAALLLRRGEETKAIALAQELLDRAARASAQYRADQRRWIEEAKRITGNAVFS